MAKKVKLSDLKVSSFVVKLDRKASRTAKGGIALNSAQRLKFEALEKDSLTTVERGPFTEHKSQRSYGNGSSIRTRVR